MSWRAAPHNLAAEQALLGRMTCALGLATQRNAARAVGQLGSVEIEIACETRSIAHRRLSLKSPDVVFTVEPGDDDGPEPKPAR